MESCRTSSIDYGNLPYIQNAISHTQYYEYPCLTTSSTDDQAPLEFRLDSTHHFTDLSQTYLSFTVNVLNKDGSKLEAGEMISTLNNFAYSIFSDIDLYIQDRKVTQGQGSYPILTYLKMLTDTTAEEKSYYLRQSLWRKDTPVFMDTIDNVQDACNQGFVDRSGYIAQSKDCPLFMKVALDFSLCQLLPAQTELFFRFHRAPASDCLIASAGEYRIKISKAKLMIAKQNLTEQASKEISHILTTKGLLFPTTRTQLRSKTLSSGDQNCDWIPFSGALPQRIYVFQILSKAFNGAIDKNMFNFQTFNIKRLQLFRNGEGLPFDQPLEIDDKSPIVPYMFTLNAINKPECINFNLHDFKNGYFICCFDLTADSSAGNDRYHSPPGTGTIRLSIDYRKALSESIAVVCVGEFAGTLMMDSYRNPKWI